MAVIPYLISFILSIAALGIGMWYYLKHVKKLGAMCCMMGGMAFGTIPALMVGVFYSVPSGDYVGGMIIATIVGLALGAPLGRYGGGLGRMEGVMGAVMGGTMGGMLGYMTRFFNVTLFMQYFIVAMAIMSIEMTYVVYKEMQGEKAKMPKNYMALQAVLFAIALATTFFLNYSVT